MTTSDLDTANSADWAEEIGADSASSEEAAAVAEGGAAEPASSQNRHELTGLTSQVLTRAVDHLLGLQAPDGYWCGELEGDSILQSEYLLMKWMLGQERDPRLPKIAAYLRRQQLPDGGWVQYPGAKTDLSATVKAYFALKLMGDDPKAAPMARARDLIRTGGGAERCNSFTKFFFAGLGQIRYDALPTIPPQIVFLPKWFFFHLDKISAWSRTMITPLSVVTTHRYVRTVPPDKGIDELYVNPGLRHRLLSTQVQPDPFWSRVFLGLDRLLKWSVRLGLTPLRSRALKRLEGWFLERLEKSDGLGAIFPPMVYIQVALRCLGYPDDHAIVTKAQKDLDDLMLEDHDRGEIRLQPCFSPVWDTGIAAYALTETGLDGRHPVMRRCARWLLAKECRDKGDWANNVDSSVEASGWFFEHNNGFYPDVDDTAMVVMALHRIGADKGRPAIRRGMDWIMAMQNNDGGWAAFDRTRHRPLLEQIPFADHNAIQDPSCPDITGRVLECLGHGGFGPEHPAVDRAIRFIRSRQEPEGGWFGRWGVNYIYGSFQVLCGLQQVGLDMNADWVRRAGQWLKSVQHEAGSFGESADSYEDPSLQGQGPPTASQTAWGAMGLMAIYGPADPAVQRAIRWLCQSQLDSGAWSEDWFTGTGFPRVFYLRYHLYRLYFPIMAIGRWLRLQNGRHHEPAMSMAR